MCEIRKKHNYLILKITDLITYIPKHQLDRTSKSKPPSETSIHPSEFIFILGLHILAIIIPHNVRNIPMRILWLK